MIDREGFLVWRSPGCQGVLSFLLSSEMLCSKAFMNSLLISLANPKAVFRSFHVLKGDLESHMIWRLLIFSSHSQADNDRNFLPRQYSIVFTRQFYIIFSQSIFSLWISLITFLILISFYLCQLKVDLSVWTNHTIRDVIIIQSVYLFVSVSHAQKREKTSW